MTILFPLLAICFAIWIIDVCGQGVVLAWLTFIVLVPVAWIVWFICMPDRPGLGGFVAVAIAFYLARKVKRSWVC